MDKKQEYACPDCGSDLTLGGAVSVRQVEYHEYRGRVVFVDGKASVDGDIETDGCDDADRRYAMCGECCRELDLESSLS